MMLPHGTCGVIWNHRIQDLSCLLPPHHHLPHSPHQQPLVFHQPLHFPLTSWTHPLHHLVLQIVHLCDCFPSSSGDNMSHLFTSLHAVSGLFHQSHISYALVPVSILRRTRRTTRLADRIGTPEK